jgi:hypothetical protein
MRATRPVKSCGTGVVRIASRSRIYFREERGRTGIEQAYRNARRPLVLRALAFAATDSVGYRIGGYSTRPDGAR